MGSVMSVTRKSNYIEFNCNVNARVLDPISEGFRCLFPMTNVYCETLQGHMNI